MFLQVNLLVLVLFLQIEPLVIEMSVRKKLSLLVRLAEVNPFVVVLLPSKPIIGSNIRSSNPVGASSICPSKPIFGHSDRACKPIRVINIRASKPVSEHVSVSDVRPSEPTNFSHAPSSNTVSASKHSHKNRKDSLETRAVLLLYLLELEISGVAVQSIHQNSKKW